MDLKSGTPFWTVQDGPIRSYPSLEESIRCEVVVLGGGLTGALAAFHLAEAGVDTVVLDKRDVGCGSTAATTALVQYEIDTPLIELTEMLGEDHASRAYLACRSAISKLEALTRRLDGGCGFERRKSLYWASTARDVDTLRREYEARRSLGFHIDWMSETEIFRAFGFARPAALLSYDAAQLDPYRLTHELLRTATSKRARVFARTGAIETEEHSDGVTIRCGNGSSVRAGTLVFATGYESQEYLKSGVLKLISTYALASTPMKELDGALREHVMWETARPYFYVRTTPDRRVMLGGEDEDFRDPERRDALLNDKTRRLAEKFRDLFPRETLSVAYAWAGTFGESKDGLAFIDRSPDLPHAYFALGCGGNGITFGMLAAEIVRDAILDRPNENADLFRFDR